MSGTCTDVRNEKLLNEVLQVRCEGQNFCPLWAGFVYQSIFYGAL